ncbi:hypothetical protein [Haloferax prahovense]|uniref:hypothetical protein n=1 Tax=Haloferax prahovense TaxID=381852 RepID=UPI001269117E|nr:hypothetical protein [Haloferax prahovense]
MESRRKFLGISGLAVAASLSGCLRGAAIRGAVRSVQRLQERTESAPEPTDREYFASRDPVELEIAPGTMVTFHILRLLATEGDSIDWEATPKQVRIQYEVEVLSGPAMDIYLFSGDEFIKFRDGQQAYFDEVGSQLSTSSFDASFVVENNSYDLTIDNPSNKKSRVRFHLLTHSAVDG